MLRSLHSIPLAVRILGFGGLVPFFATSIAAIATGPSLRHFFLQALLSYGAIILSFLGGIRWGLASARHDVRGLLMPLFISVLPAILAWLSLLLPVFAGLMVLSISLSAMLWADLKLATAPAWYPVLRLYLSIGAIVALLLGLATS